MSLTGTFHYSFFDGLIEAHVELRPDSAIAWLVPDMDKLGHDPKGMLNALGVWWGDHAAAWAEAHEDAAADRDDAEYHARRDAGVV